MKDTNLLFKEVGYNLGSLLDSIALGVIGLPEIQRPFVWKNAKGRDLFDSMYRGYPVGYLLLWQNANAEGSKGIGVEGNQKHPSLLIVDGQQRLTSLYAASGLGRCRGGAVGEGFAARLSRADRFFGGQRLADAAVV